MGPIYNFPNCIMFGFITAIGISYFTRFKFYKCLYKKDYEKYCEMDRVLTYKRDFIGCIFGFQMFVWDIAKDYHINIFGAILMEIFITAFAIYYNILSFIVLTICFVIKYFCKAFVFMFRKRK